MAEAEETRTARERGIEPRLEGDRVWGVADVLCDETGRLGSLSYVVPDDMPVHLGDAVHIPFGKRTLHGVVLDVGDPEKATRDIVLVHGRRVSSAEVGVAREIARLHFTTVSQVASRFSPRSGRGAQPLEAGEVVLTPYERPIHYPKTAESRQRRYLLRAPLVDPARLAAEEALRLSSVRETAQVLVLCPTVDLVEDVLSHFESGAVRVDTKAPEGAWRGLCDGGVKVAVGTRSAALFSARDLAGMIVVEEEQFGHVEQSQPYTHARDVAALRTSALDVPLVLIGATPTPVALGAKVKVVPVGNKTNDWPRVKVVDRRDESPSERLVPPALRIVLERAKKDGVTPIVLAERRAAIRRCTRCGLERKCQECESSLCTHQETMPCGRCGTTEVRMSGWDTKRLGQLLGKSVKPLQLKAFSERRDAQVGVVFDIDKALNMPGLSTESPASKILLQAARSVGEGGTLVVLTSQSDHPVIVDLCRKRDQVAAAKRAWESAQSAGLPPFGRLVTIRSGQGRSPRTSGWPGRILGPRKVGDEWEVLVQIPDEELDSLRPHVERLRRGGKIRVSVS